MMDDHPEGGHHDYVQYVYTYDDDDDVEAQHKPRERGALDDEMMQPCLGITEQSLSTRTLRSNELTWPAAAALCKRRATNEARPMSTRLMTTTLREYIHNSAAAAGCC